MSSDHRRLIEQIERDKARLEKLLSTNEGLSDEDDQELDEFALDLDALALAAHQMSLRLKDMAARIRKEKG